MTQRRRMSRAAVERTPGREAGPGVRCTWCHRAAVAWSIGTEDPPDCGRSACTRATDEVWRAREALRARLARGRTVSVEAYAATQAAARRAELRSAPVDWTRPVEGWVLW